MYKHTDMPLLEVIISSHSCTLNGISALTEMCCVGNSDTFYDVSIIVVILKSCGQLLINLQKQIKHFH